MTLTPAAQALLDVFERIVIINLPEREDRRRGMERELARIGLSLSHPAVEIFSAVRPTEAAGFPTIGAHGAFQSHLGVMKRMLAQGSARVLVLEDDMAFAPGAVERLPALAQGLGARPWALAYGHPGEDAGQAGTPDAAGLVTLPPELGLIQLHFLGLSQQAAEVAIPELEAMLGRPSGSPEGGPMHVDGALNWVRARHPDLIALAAAPAIAVQRSSRSDIAPPRWFDRLPVVRHLTDALRRLR